jgi:hypothetical protein
MDGYSWCISQEPDKWLERSRDGQSWCRGKEGNGSARLPFFVDGWNPWFLSVAAFLGTCAVGYGAMATSLMQSLQKGEPTDTGLDPAQIHARQLAGHANRRLLNTYRYLSWRRVSHRCSP